MKIFEVKPKINPAIYKKASKLYKGFYASRREQLEDYLEQMGWILLDEGQFSMVFSNPKKTYILKINEEPDPAFAEYINLIKKHKNKHFIRVSDVKQMQVSQSMYYIYLIEKLSKIPTSQGDYISSYLENIAQDAQEYGKPLGPKDLYGLFGKKLPNFLSDTLLNAVNILGVYSSTRPGLIIDIHGDNIMRRNDGTIVITDPYS